MLGGFKNKHGNRYPSVEKEKTHPHLWANGRFFGAEDEIRTRDPHLGKVMLYQLSYFRVWALVGLQI